MSQYVLQIAEAVEQLFTSVLRSQPDRFAGHVAKLDFLLDEFEHARTIADGYPARFEQLNAATRAYCEAHGLPFHVTDPDCTVGVFFPTTSGGERGKGVGRCRELLEKIIERALKLELIPLEHYHAALDRLDRR